MCTRERVKTYETETVALACIFSKPPKPKSVNMDQRSVTSLPYEKKLESTIPQYAQARIGYWNGEQRYVKDKYIGIIHISN